MEQEVTSLKSLQYLVAVSGAKYHAFLVEWFGLQSTETPISRVLNLTGICCCLSTTTN